ncbi:hypothetical protein [Caldiplasma sukawensis]
MHGIEEEIRQTISSSYFQLFTVNASRNLASHLREHYRNEMHNVLKNFLISRSRKESMIVSMN